MTIPNPDQPPMVSSLAALLGILTAQAQAITAGKALTPI